MRLLRRDHRLPSPRTAGNLSRPARTWYSGPNCTGRSSSERYAIGAHGAPTYLLATAPLFSTCPSGLAITVTGYKIVVYDWQASKCNAGWVALGTISDNRWTMIAGTRVSLAVGTNLDEADNAHKEITVSLETPVTVTLGAGGVTPANLHVLMAMHSPGTADTTAGIATHNAVSSISDARTLVVASAAWGDQSDPANWPGAAGIDLSAAALNQWDPFIRVTWTTTQPLVCSIATPASGTKYRIPYRLTLNPDYLKLTDMVVADTATGIVSLYECVNESVVERAACGFQMLHTDNSDTDHADCFSLATETATFAAGRVRLYSTAAADEGRNAGQRHDVLLCRGWNYRAAGTGRTNAWWCNYERGQGGINRNYASAPDPTLHPDHACNLGLFDWAQSYAAEAQGGETWTRTPATAGLQINSYNCHMFKFTATGTASIAAVEVASEAILLMGDSQLTSSRAAYSAGTRRNLGKFGTSLATALGGATMLLANQGCRIGERQALDGGLYNFYQHDIIGAGEGCKVWGATLVIAVGINDLTATPLVTYNGTTYPAQQLAKMLRRLEEIIDTAYWDTTSGKHSGQKVVLLGIPPMNAATAAQARSIRTWNFLLASLAYQHGLGFYNPWPDVVDKATTWAAVPQFSSTYTADGSHYRDADAAVNALAVKAVGAMLDTSYRRVPEMW